MLDVRPLRRHEVDALFPLMQSVLQQLSLDQWRAYAGHFRHALEEPTALHGIMIAITGSGVMRAAFVYEIQRRFDDSQTLFVHHLVVRHLAVPPLGQVLAADALAHAMQVLARERTCRTISIELPANAEWEIGYFRQRGCSVEIVEPSAILRPVSA